ncbi:MAG TPA: hypothetical protein PKB01_01070 [Xanthobacteraceae bacterium]|nr:hypothetical protein [Xanthobacteraceae bacterium]
MRSLMAARLVLLDSDAARRDNLCKELDALIPGVAGISAVSEAARFVSDQPDLYIIDHGSLAANDDVAVLPNPFAGTGAATILLLAGASTAQRREAARAGYTAVLGKPVSTRLLYRRVAHVLQIARRVKRRAELEQKKAAKPALELVPPSVAASQG